MRTFRHRIARLALALTAVLGAGGTVTIITAAPAQAFPHNPGLPQGPPQMPNGPPQMPNGPPIMPVRPPGLELGLSATVFVTA